MLIFSAEVQVSVRKSCTRMHKEHKDSEYRRRVSLVRDARFQVSGFGFSGLKSFVHDKDDVRLKGSAIWAVGKNRCQGH